MKSHEIIEVGEGQVNKLSHRMANVQGLKDKRRVQIGTGTIIVPEEID